MRSRAWSLVAFRLLAAIGAAVAAGFIFGYPVLWVIAVLATYLSWNLYHVYRLDRWLNFRRGRRPRSAPGVWGSIYAGVYRVKAGDKEKKKRLKRVLKEFRKATGAIPDASVVLNENHEIVWLNKIAATYLGITRADRGRRIENLLRDPAFIEYVREEDYSGAVPMISPVDGKMNLLVRIIPYGAGQRLLLAKDVTRERRLEKIRRDFVGNASHELRSPLTVVSGYLDSMGEDPEMPEGWREPVREMSAQATRMRCIIDDLLTLSRLEASATPAQEDRVEVARLMAMIRKDALASRSPCAYIDLDFESEAAIQGSESELYSALWNLLQNAVKYTAPEGRIVVRWTTDADGGHLSVKDTGIGIPAEAIPRLTERFFRVDKGRDRARGGTGLGLAIVKHVLQRHGAILEIESQPGVGSTFTCLFPPDRIADADRGARTRGEAG